MITEPGRGGWLVIDKPAGITSSRVVERVRRATGMKAGHAGTLDPLATGILPVALGEATKTVGFISKAAKRYSFCVRWGIATATEDSEGEIVAESPARPDAAAIRNMLPRFIGVIDQRPPAYSAIKIAGRRAYALARAGKPTPLAGRRVTIAELELTALPDPDHAEFIARVGKAPISAPSPAISPKRSARGATSLYSGASASGTSAKPKQFRWIWRLRLGIVCSLPGIYCRLKPRWTTSRPWL